MVQPLTKPPFLLQLTHPSTSAQRAGGSTKANIAVAVHPLASVTVTVCVPPQSELAAAALDPELQAKDNDPVPPEAFAVPAPLQELSQLNSVMLVNAENESAFG